MFALCAWGRHLCLGIAYQVQERDVPDSQQMICEHTQICWADNAQAAACADLGFVSLALSRELYHPLLKTMSYELGIQGCVDTL